MLSVVAALSLTASTLASAIPSDVPDASWGTNERVSAIAQSSSTVYQGGYFTTISENGGAGAATLARNHLAALDASTGAPLEGWNPNIDGNVYALALSADGSTLFVGGDFSTVGTVSRSNLVALDATTGAIKSTLPLPTPNGAVRAMSIKAGKIFLGGSFTRMGGALRNRLAAVDEATGILDPTWQPSADDNVRAITATDDGSRVFAGGDFLNVSGIPRATMVAIDSAGTVVPDWDAGPNARIFNLATQGTLVYAAVGGGPNSVYAWDTTTGAQKWRRTSDGDFQALDVTRGIVYAGGHFNYIGAELRRKVVALDASTGAVRRAWRPKLPNAWGSWAGIWAVSVYNESRLALGGDFDVVSGYPHTHYAQFTGSIGGAVGDVTAPTAPAGLSATPRGSAMVNLSWSASTDNDGVAGYRVYRNGKQIGTAPTNQYTDAKPTASTSYTYHVVAYDFAGNNSSASLTVSATTPVANEVLTFPVSEDASIDSTNPDLNFGATSTLTADSEPPKDFLLKFPLVGITGRQIVSAKLRLRNVGQSNVGGEFHWLKDNSWLSSTVTWNNAPAADPAILAPLDDVSPGKTYEVDVTPIVKDDGFVSVRVSSPGSNDADWASIEGSLDNAPQLVVTLAGLGETVPADPAFSEGFESGDLSRWNLDTGLLATQDDPFAGGWVARARSTGQATYATKQLRVSIPDLSYRARFKILDQGGSAIYLMRIRTSDDTKLVRLFVGATGLLATRNEITGQTTTSSTQIDPNRWYTAQIRLRVGDPDSSIEVFLDGARIDSLSKADLFGTVPSGQIEFGDNATGKSYDVLFDGILADGVIQDDMPPPPAPTGLDTRALSRTSVRVTWSDAPSGSGVSGYEIYRNNVPVASVGLVTSYQDNGLTAGTTYTYKIKARNAAGNLSPFSSSSTVTTLAADQTPPTPPSNVAATTVTFNRIDLSWNAASDDDGIGGYKVFRDGGLIATLGPTARTYSDVSVAPSTSYSYSMTAVDISANESNSSSLATATTVGLTEFYEAFESDDFSQWTGGSGMTIEDQTTFDGSHAARAQTTNGARYLTKQLPSSYSSLSYGIHFKLVSHSSTFTLMRFQTGAGSSLLDVSIKSNGMLATTNGTTLVDTVSTTPVSTGTWHTLRATLSLNGVASQINIWLDGNLVGALSRLDMMGATPIGRIQLGNSSTGKTYDTIFDSVTLDTPPINTVAPSLIGSSQSLLGSNRGAWTGTAPITYSYQWLRCDPSGNGCAPVVGATGSTYSVTAADSESTLRVRVFATNVGGATSSVSSPSSVVPAEPKPAVVVVPPTPAAPPVSPPNPPASGGGSQTGGTAGNAVSKPKFKVRRIGNRTTIKASNRPAGAYMVVTITTGSQKRTIRRRSGLIYATTPKAPRRIQVRFELGSRRSPTATYSR